MTSEDRPGGPESFLAAVAPSIDGWFDEPDIRMFFALGWAQEQLGVGGNILEIGSYLGKSAILLAELVHGGEELVVNDLWDDLDVDREQWHHLTTAPSRSTFESNFERFGAAPPRVVCGPSATALQAEPDRAFRIVHVDGSHEYDDVTTDVVSARRLVAADGVIVLDDHMNLRFPGVAAAVWGAVDRGLLVPRALTRAKLYATTHADALPLDMIEAAAVRFGLDASRRRCRDHAAIRIELPRRPPPSSFVPPVLLPALRRARATLRRR